MPKLPPSERPERQNPPEILRVGSPYDPSRRHWPPGADYNYRAGGHELRLFLQGISKDEILAVREGKAEFGLLIDQPELYVISRFWRPDASKIQMSFDCSYQWWRVSAAERTAPPAWEEVSPAARSLVTVILVEATNGVILALRAVTYSPEFSRSINHAIADQAALPYDPAEHDRRVAALVRKYNTDALWSLCDVRCTGGD
jgi:hypothetical protein